VIAAIEGITTLDSDVGGESFVEVDQMGPDDRLPERGFAVQLQAIAPPSLITHDNQMARYLVRVFYADTPAIEDRISDDLERIIQKLYNLHATASSGDLYAVQMEEAAVSPAAFENMLEVAIPVGITYRLTGV
jgi:hypothetical protein